MDNRMNLYCSCFQKNILVGSLNLLVKSELNATEIFVLTLHSAVCLVFYCLVCICLSYLAGIAVWLNLCLDTLEPKNIQV